MVFLKLTIVLATFTAIIGNIIGDYPVPGPQNVFKVNKVTVDGVPNEYYSSLNITSKPDGLSATVEAVMNKKMPENSTVEVTFMADGQEITSVQYPICDTPILEQLSCPDDFNVSATEWSFSFEIIDANPANVNATVIKILFLDEPEETDQTVHVGLEGYVKLRDDFNIFS